MKFTLFHCCARTGKGCTSKVKPMCWSEHQSYAAENAEDSWCASEGRFLFFLPFVFLAVNVIQFFLSYICHLMGEKLNCYCPVNCFQSLADHFLPSLQTDNTFSQKKMYLSLWNHRIILWSVMNWLNSYQIVCFLAKSRSSGKKMWKRREWEAQLLFLSVKLCISLLKFSEYRAG